MSDDMIKLLAKNGGVIQIAFGSSFISSDFREREDEATKEILAYFRSRDLKFSDPEAQEYIRKYQAEHAIPFATVSQVADHIDHVVKLVGVDYVGFGSDFDGVGPTTPVGLKDVSQYPNLIEELLKRGYSDKDIQKICGGNLLRVWSVVERRAKELQAGS
jgi:membrane dipeptidase